MKLFEQFFENNSTRYCDCSEPESLPGVKKKSFVLPFRGGEIWFEHLDGMYQYTDLVLEKLKNDSHIFLLPSKPSQIGFVLDETLITKAIVEKIVKLLCDERKGFMRVCFIGTDRKIQQMFRGALKDKSCFAFSFINDFEKAKEWLVSE
ncbi:MAG: hypothetical protein ACI4F7_08475 [Acutalibacteraceae bacterium]